MQTARPHGSWPRLLALLLLLGWAGALRAQTDEIQVYDAQITDPGRFNLTWHNNFTPSGRHEADFPGGVVPDHALNGVPEWAYGVSDWFELGAYVPVYTLTDDGRLLFDSVKLRSLFVAPHARERKYFYGVNFELSYNSPHWERSRYSLEIRPILGTHLGRFDLIINPIFDSAFDGLGGLDFAPAARVAYNVSDTLALALEHYADFGPIRHFDAGPDQAHSLFAAVDYGHGGDSLEAGVGRGLTRATDRVVLKLMLMHDF